MAKRKPVGKPDNKKPWEDDDAGLVDSNLQADRAKSSGPSPAMRFWIPKGEERRIIFLTEGNQAKRIWEHQVRLNGDWRNWVSSLTWFGHKDDPLKDFSEETGMFRRYNAYAFTIIDTQEFTDRSGQKRKNVKKLLLAKRDTAEILKRMYLKRLDADTGLRGAMFDVYRTNSDKSASVGEQFEFVKMVDLSAFEDTDEFDLSEIFFPEPDRVKEIVSQLRRENGIAESETEESDEDVESSTVDY